MGVGPRWGGGVGGGARDSLILLDETGSSCVSFRILNMFDFFGFGGGSRWTEAFAGTELGRTISAGGDIGIGRLALAGDLVGVF